MVPTEDWSALSMQCRHPGGMEGHAQWCPARPMVQGFLVPWGTAGYHTSRSIKHGNRGNPCRQGSVLSTEPQKGRPWFQQAEPKGQDGSCGQHWHFLPAPPHPRPQTPGATATASWARHQPHGLGDKRTHLGGCPLTHFPCRRQGRDWRRQNPGCPASPKVAIWLSSFFPPVRATR